MGFNPARPENMQRTNVRLFLPLAFAHLLVHLLVATKRVLHYCFQEALDRHRR
jgi:hypothetical protein